MTIVFSYCFLLLQKTMFADLEHKKNFTCMLEVTKPPPVEQWLRYFQHTLPRGEEDGNRDRDTGGGRVTIVLEAPLPCGSFLCASR